jgi:2-polyprenyl-3-methyl-5-hydroxy-6-metoxy-1,4-benzoquinol methylase
MDTIDIMLAKAEKNLTSNWLEAEQLYLEILRHDPINLSAHNALEQMQSKHSYGDWMRVNCTIDVRDDIFRFFAEHAESKNPIRDYLSDGWRTLSELMILLEQAEQPLLKIHSVLEFAAGFGRFTRHLVKALPSRISCTDVLPGSTDFLKQQFGVDAFESFHDPTLINTNDKYELVFVLSMFTHLPIHMWRPWLTLLGNMVQPGGLLVFSVHNEAVAKAREIVFDGQGTCFIASSESPLIDGDRYGTTYTTRQFVEACIQDVFGAPPLLYRERAFWRGQDAVVIRFI